MSIKNSLKILFNRFQIVGEILLFLLIMLVVFCGLGAIYVQPIIQAAVDLQLHEVITQFYEVLFSGNGLEVVLEQGGEVLDTIKRIFIAENGIVYRTVVVPILFFVTFNLLASMYELPLCKVLEGRMSSNAKLSLMGNVISLSGKSALYVLVKLIFVIVYEIIMFFVMWGVYALLRLTSMTLLIPFAELLVMLLIGALRNCFTVTWVQHIIIGEKKIFPAFALSVREGFGHFQITAATYFVSWLMAIVINGLMALLTFGVGLIISIPVSMLYFKLLGMTAYYSWHDKRYYLDGNTIVGNQPEKTDKLD